MYDNWPVNLLVACITAIVVALAVLMHYEGLVWLSRRLPKLHTRARRKVLYVIYGVITIHIVEIWLFGIAYWLLLMVPSAGGVVGSQELAFFDAVYLSAVTFTTVGFGDLTPIGPIRFVAGTEALTGFILITWSASFTFLEMERFWRER
jgi:Ion channel